MTRTPPQQITARIYVQGEPVHVQGYVTAKHLGGRSFGADEFVMVDILTADGDTIYNALARWIDVCCIEPRDFGRFTEHMLWRVIEKDMGGCAELAFVELLRREKNDAFWSDMLSPC